MMKGCNHVCLINITIPKKPEFDDAVGGILEKPGYRHLTGGFLDFIKKVKDGIREWLIGIMEKTFSNLENVPELSERLSTIFMIIGLLLIIAIIVFIIIKVSRTFDRKASIREILGEKIDDRATPLSLRERAREFTQGGDFRQAIRYDFIAVLFLMHERNILFLDEAKTGEEIYSYLRKNKFENAVLFKSLVGIFNAAWYGHKPLGQGLYDEWNGILGSIWNGVMNGEKKNQ